jgi:hypothetical protein
MRYRMYRLRYDSPRLTGLFGVASSVARRRGGGELCLRRL